MSSIKANEQFWYLFDEIGIILFKNSFHYQLKIMLFMTFNTESWKLLCGNLFNSSNLRFMDFCVYYFGKISPQTPITNLVFITEKYSMT